MIVVNLKRSYPLVQLGTADLNDVTLGAWAGVTDEAIERFGDVILGVYQDKVVSAYDITGHSREDDRVTFEGNESAEFEHLIGQQSPVPAWKRGQARPTRYIETEIVRTGSAPVELIEDGIRRAVVAGYTLTVDSDNIATITVPRGGVVTVVTGGAE
ncbi:MULTISPECIES: hypothetical protein [unclassified Agromyces]|uniref:hypothetical protein n=1 Tax=unclassified Agromyces TaxID=2639701 RepID=UPI003014C9A0